MKLLDISITYFSKNEIFNDTNYPIHLITLNSQYFVSSKKDKKLKKIIEKGSKTIDGQIPWFLFKLKYPFKKIKKLSGSDIIYEFAKIAQERKWSIFLLGGNKNSNIKAVERLSDKFNITIFGHSFPVQDYPFDNSTKVEIQEKIKVNKPDIIFVNFGVPKQDYWISDNMDFLTDQNIKYIIGAGGTVDFVAGKIKRAPVIVQKIGLESIFRLIQEPTKARLRRIFQSSFIFFYFFKIWK